MKTVKLFFLSFVSIVAMASCQDEKGQDVVKSSENVINEGVKASSFTISVNSTFNNLSFDDRTYGGFGVLYSNKDSIDIAAFNLWGDGDNSAIADKTLKQKYSNSINGSKVSVLVDNLVPLSTYYVTPFFESEDGKVRWIGTVEEVQTKEFNVGFIDVDAQDVKFFSASLTASLANIDSLDFKYCTVGYLYSEYENPDIENSELIKENNTVLSKDFSLKAKGLKHNTRYYYRPCVYNSVQDTYTLGKVSQFNTKNYDDIALDMGTSVLWSPYLLGADNDLEQGDLYRWGEIEPFKTGTIFNSLKSGLLDAGINDISGSEYDPVKHRLGGKWRMPTAQEFEELNKACTLRAKAMKDYNDNYLILRSKSTNNVINIPQTGYGYTYGTYGEKMTVYGKGGRFYLWTSNVEEKEITETGYWVVNNDLYEQYLLEHDSFTIEDLVRIGAVETRTQTYTTVSIPCVYPNNWLDWVEDYNSGAMDLNDNEWLLKLSDTSSDFYGYCILAVRDKD